MLALKINITNFILRKSLEITLMIQLFFEILLSIF